jgi:hypothetical protein
MDRTFQYEARPGSLTLSLVTLAGLILLAAQLWPIIPGYVLLIFIPALLVSIAQLVITPVYRLRLSDETLRIEAGTRAQDLPMQGIAYLRVEDRAARPEAVIVLDDGSEVEMPQLALPDPLVLIREATNRGIPVRHA